MKVARTLVRALNMYEREGSTDFSPCMNVREREGSTDFSPCINVRERV
ncbi:MAG: hypothetical protein U5L45_14200 [Saprospiraceae bacterium]|nr:hypothetical protein [Saprospiraceae bacterium]